MTTPENSTPVTLPPIPTVKKDSALAIVSLVCGLVGWTFLPLIGAIAAIITGHLAKKEIRDSAGTLSGNGMAIAGLIMGYVQIGFVLLAVICMLTFFLALMPAIERDFSIYSALIPALI